MSPETDTAGDARHYPQLNVATALTWMRIAAIPAVAMVFYWPGHWSRPLSCLVFTLAGLTDLLDGYLARRLGQTSKFGAFLDPVADKLMVAVVLILIVQADPRVAVALAAAVIIGREIAVSALREWMAELGARSRVAVSGIGKAKTTLQMIGLGAMLYRHDLRGLPVYDIGFALLIVAAVITLWSMVGYVRATWPGRAGNR
ncbi:MAG: CDP-diacylglycerol--glycerol-3-phosphate 3-phosphatidyltransferase [Gammaproteobacteria bacterium]|nr:CDP-diacylglycerol--glycerol-3-phosphate 3-phosphatidyltransferase [Gammaproteobacteria bacterium]